MQWKTKDKDGFWVDVVLDERHLAHMVDRAMNTAGGKSRGGPVEVRLRRPKVNFLVIYPGRRGEEGYPDRERKEVLVKGYAAEAARRTGAGRLARVYADGYGVGPRACTVEEVK